MVGSHRRTVSVSFTRYDVHLSPAWRSVGWSVSFLMYSSSFLTLKHVVRLRASNFRERNHSSSTYERPHYSCSRIRSRVRSALDRVCRSCLFTSRRRRLLGGISLE